MMQHQQATLEKVLQNQQVMKKRQSEMETKISELEAKCDSIEPSSVSASSGKRKLSISRQLSVSIVLQGYIHFFNVTGGLADFMEN